MPIQASERGLSPRAGRAMPPQLQQHAKGWLHDQPLAHPSPVRPHHGRDSPSVLCHVPQATSELGTHFAYTNQTHHLGPLPRRADSPGGRLTSRMYPESVTGGGRSYAEGGSWASQYSPVQFGHQVNGDNKWSPATRNFHGDHPQQQRDPGTPPHENMTFGVGIEFASGRRELVVSSLVPGCSAHANGTICEGDEMLEAGGVAGLDFKQAREIILGTQGTTVDLTFRRQSMTYRVTLMRGNSGFIQLEKKNSALLLENENLRSQLRRQNQETQRLSDETHQQRKQLADSQALQAHLNHMQGELQTVASEKDQLRVLIEEQDARIQDLEQRLLSANARDERAGNSDASLLHKVNTTYTLYNQPEAQGPEPQAIGPSLHSLHTNSVPHVAA
jgi:hypothetical protein